MKNCEIGDCMPENRERGGICCKDCPNKDGCEFACSGSKLDSICEYELEE